MMQIVSFLTQYAEELSLLMDSLTIVLLFVALHRIKSARKWMQEIAGNAKGSACEQAIYEKLEEGQKEEMRQAQTEDINEEQIQEKLHCAVPQEELLAAVLGEVFP